MKEERYAYRVRQVLNHGLKDIPPAASRRLELRATLRSQSRSRQNPNSLSLPEKTSLSSQTDTTLT